MKDLEDFDIEERSTVALECQTSQEVKVTWKRGKKVIKESDRYEVTLRCNCPACLYEHSYFTACAVVPRCLLLRYVLDHNDE